MSSEIIWLAIGFVGQFLFGSRFLVQWIASERARASVIPMSFWWLSLAGGTVLLAYAIQLGDPVFIVGQSTGSFIYLRNVWLRIRSDRLSADQGDVATASSRSASR